MDTVGPVDLIDTTEMYLKTVFEMEEDGVVPMRARIVERLGHSGPTVSQTVARMERDGLVTLGDDRRLELTAQGRRMAREVMRKHRLAECLLISVVGLDWAAAHEEACRWEHVMSRDVEEKLNLLLEHPSSDPYGNPIPALDEGSEHSADAPAETSVDLLPGVGEEPYFGVVTRIGEPIQAEREALEAMKDVGILPGTAVAVALRDHDLLIWSAPAGQQGIDPEEPDVRLSALFAPHLFVGSR